MGKSRTIIVVGASAGGGDALRILAAGLRPGINASVFIVLHVGASRSVLPKMLSFSGRLPASHPSDGERIKTGHIYVAPPDRHLTLSPQHIRLARGAVENW